MRLSGVRGARGKSHCVNVHGKVNSLQPDDSESGSFGVNITLLSNIGNYFNDAQGMDTNGKQLEGKGGVVLKGLERDDEARSRVPVYKLNL